MSKKYNDSTSLLGQIILFFRNLFDKIKNIHLISKIKQRQKRLAHYEGESSTNEAKLSYTFGILKIISVVLLCVLLCLTAIFGGSIISYEKVYYMFKDIQYIHSYGEAKPEQLNYSRPMARQDFTVFKNGLAVASDSEIKFFTSTGRVTLTEGSDYSNPKLSASNNSLLVYDQGNKSFAVYNSFTELYQEKLDFPISYGYMSEIGTYSLVTKSQKYKSVVKVYNGENSLEIEYSKNDHILSAPISNNGKHLAVVSMDVSNGESVVSLNILDINKGSVRSSMELKDTMAYSCEFIGNDRIALFCSDYVAVYTLDLAARGRYDYPSSVIRTSCTGDGFSMAFQSDGIRASSLAVMFDRNGSVIFSGTIDGDVRDLKLNGGYMYALTDGQIYRFDTKFGNKSIADFSSEGQELIIFDGGVTAVCTSAAAYYISFD